MKEPRVEMERQRERERERRLFANYMQVSIAHNVLVYTLSGKNNQKSHRKIGQ